ncbi:threonine synthase [Anaeromicrobium sediminis]|uniref:Threonine synthase n=1 Tax=Anaeromicrobium sediminis TaxID=1478221 RepID=A0A267MLV6_9FIRM|nr:threonine synthase [Anaeromicrobium sediminis]PAB59855.1 threonine synthase [Anaeromicrobium sediminis]
MKDIKFICTKCNKEFPIDKALYRCDVCNEPLEVEEIKEGKIKEGNVLNQTILDRYSEFFPFVNVDNEIGLGEGFTSLVESKELAENLGVGKIYFKNESQNPTWSFKDRGTIAGVQHALKLGYKRIGTVSTGNMAPSVAAYGSKAGLETFVFVSKHIAPEKLNPIAIYNPNLIKVDGDYGSLYYESLKIGKENNIYFINSDAPFRVEGSKTIAFEICEQLNFNMPDYVVVPTSAGGNIRGIEKGFREFKNCGFIDRVPKIICAQASGCSPIYNAYNNKSETIERFENPNTIAHAIENPFPPSGNETLRIIKKNGGTFVAVSDEEIVECQGILAQSGIFGQPASAVPLAAVRKLKEENYFKGNEKIVCVVTGSGLKYTAAFEKHNLVAMECKIEELSDFIRDEF